MISNWIFLQKVDEAQKNNEFTEFHTHVFIYITCLKEIIDFLISEIDLQLVKAMFQLLQIYCTISILIYYHKWQYFYHMGGKSVESRRICHWT